MDSLFNQVKNDLIHLISENRESGEFCIDLLMLSLIHILASRLSVKKEVTTVPSSPQRSLPPVALTVSEIFTRMKLSLIHISLF